MWGPPSYAGATLHAIINPLEQPLRGPEGSRGNECSIGSLIEQGLWLPVEIER